MNTGHAKGGRAEAPDNPESVPADFTVIRGDRLVAYVWRRAHGQLRMAGARGEDPTHANSYAEVVCFQRAELGVLVAIMERAKDLEQCLFGLGVEGFRVETGCLSPHSAMRRF